MYFWWARFCPSALVVTKSRFRQIRGEIFENDLRRQVPFSLKSWVHFVVKPQFCFCILFFFLLQGGQPACGSWLFFLLWVRAQFLAVMSYFPHPSDGNCCPFMAAFVAPLAVEAEWLVSAPVVVEPCTVWCVWYFIGTVVPRFGCFWFLQFHVFYGLDEFVSVIGGLLK